MAVLRAVGTYAYNLGDALSCLVNAVLGGDPRESISLRIGRSIERGGLASRLPIPKGLAAHFVRVARRNA